MLRFKIFLFFALIAFARSENQIPEKYRTAKSISAHLRYQNHQLQKNFSENLNNNLGISSLIVGGEPADLGQFPHHALIFIVYPNGDSKFFTSGLFGYTALVTFHPIFLSFIQLSLL